MHQWLGISGAAERARWLGQLSVALDEAQGALHRLGVVATDSPMGIDLYLRIEEARRSVRALQSRSAARPVETTDPKWTKPSPWCARVTNR